MDPVKILRAKVKGRTLREIADEAGMSVGHVHDTLTGRREPAGKVLAYLGLERRITYVKAKSANRASGAANG